MNIELMLDLVVPVIFAFFASFALVRGAKMFSLVRELRTSKNGAMMFAGTAPANTEEVEDSGSSLPSRLLGGHNGRGERRSRLDRRRKLAGMRRHGI